MQGYICYLEGHIYYAHGTVLYPTLGGVSSEEQQSQEILKESNTPE